MSYLSIIQKDLPLATWGLNETPSGNAASDTFINLDGTYSAAQSVKSVPIVYGSEQSVILDDNDILSYALKIPSLDRMSEKTKREPFSIEFWIKFLYEGGTQDKLQIMGKLGHEHTGIYIHNSSIVAMAGDTIGSFISTSVALPNLHKPLHIVMSYTEESLSLTVNGQMSSVSSTSSVINSEYDSENEFFTFNHIEGMEYAIDNIALYSHVLDIQTIRRHLAYGLGYEIPNQVPESFGGTRYSLSMSGTKPMCSYSHPWSSYSSINNLIIKDGYLTIPNIEKPEQLTSSDKDQSVFSIDSNGISTEAGGYIQIDSPITLAGGLGHGFGFTFNKTASISTLETLVYSQNSFDVNKYLHIFIESNTLKYQLNGDTPVTLKSLSTTEEISFGYFYDISTLELTVFCVDGTSDTVTDKKFYPEYIRIFSKPTFSENDEYPGDDSVSTNTALASVFDITTDTILGDECNRYRADISTAEKRFIMSASGTYSFNIDAKRLAGTNGVIGNNYVSWGNDSPEVDVTMAINPDSEGSVILTNRRQIEDIVLESPGTNKYLTFTIYVLANDIEINPTKIYYFNLFTYPTTDTGETTIVCDGPDIVVDNFTSFPERLDVPFLYNEESGGLYIGGQVSIDYDYAPIAYSGSDATEDTATVRSISFFMSPTNLTSDVMSIGGTVVTLSGTTLSGTGVTFYVNGEPSSTVTLDQWNHVLVVLPEPMDIPETIYFGGADPYFSIDEIMVLGKEISGEEALSIFNLYKGNNISVVDSEDTSLSLIDTEISNDTYGFSEYQPLNTEEYLLNQVDYVVSSKKTTYSSPSDLSIDGEILAVGDRVLVTGASPGIYTVNALTYGSSITWSSAQSLSGHSLVFVNSGAVGKGKYYFWNGSSWTETVATPKIKSYSISSNPPYYVDAYSAKEI